MYGKRRNFTVTEKKATARSTLLVDRLPLGTTPRSASSDPMPDDASEAADPLRQDVGLCKIPEMAWEQRSSENVMVLAYTT